MTTNTGFEFEIVEGVFDDWEFIELLGELESGNGLKLPAVLERLIGAEGAAALKEHCRDSESGKVTVKAMRTELTDIMTEAAGKGKKKN